MAPKAYEMTAEERNRIPLLASYQCRLCKKWKGVHMFSKKEQKEWQNKKKMNPHITGDSSAGVRCSGCAGQQVHELICAGHCGLAKALDEFSKTQRRRGAGWCKECVLWRESTEPGLTMSAAPNSELAPDEETKVRRGGYTTNSYWDPEEGGDSDDENYDDGFDVPYQQLSSLGIAGGDSTATASGYNAPQSRSGEAVQISLPPHLRSMRNTSSLGRGYIPPHLRNGSGQVPSTNGTSIRSQYIPPHLRTAGLDRETDIASQSSISNVYATSTQTGGTGWTSTDYRRSHGDEPIRTAPAAETTPRARETGSGNWARAVGTRRPSEQSAPAPPRPVIQTHYDSDESQDEI